MEQIIEKLKVNIHNISKIRLAMTGIGAVAGFLMMDKTENKKAMVFAGAILGNAYPITIPTIAYLALTNKIEYHYKLVLPK